MNYELLLSLGVALAAQRINHSNADYYKSDNYEVVFTLALNIINVTMMKKNTLIRPILQLMPFLKLLYMSTL